MPGHASSTAIRACAAQLRAANKTYAGCFEFVRGKLKTLSTSCQGGPFEEFQQVVLRASVLLEQYAIEAEKEAKQLDKDAESWERIMNARLPQQ